MSPREEPTNCPVDMIVSRPVSHQPRAVAEVTCPATQEIVQPGAHVIPGATLDGTIISATRALRRCTLFGDGLAPRYQ
jgi:hypothetical protein